MTSSNRLTRILFVENDPNDATVVKETLQNTVNFRHAVASASCLEEAVERLRTEPFDSILLDLIRIDSTALLAIRSLEEAAPETPIIILTNAYSRAASAQVFQLGVQEFLERRELTPQRMVQAFCHSIERHRLVVHLRNLSILDPLTGLYNRRGFLTSAEERISTELSKGNNADSASFALFYGDLDDLKLINDHLGHTQGDAALRQTAALLCNVFSSPKDLLARIGGDEFVALTRLKGVEGEVDRLLQRVDEAFYRLNASGQNLYAISMTIGACVSTGAEVEIASMIDKADAIACKKKREANVAGQRVVAL
ncbi:MAG: GGDEF domain-containing response regulator [Opitutales bacterium]